MAKNLFAFMLVGLLVAITDGQTTQPMPKKTAESRKAQSGKPTSFTDFELKDSEREDRVVPVRVYHDDTKKKYPVILFSHGLGGSSKNSPYLGNFWAENGYIAVFMQHHGSDIDVIKNARPLEKFRVLKSAASAKSAGNRTDDVSFVLDQIESWNVDKSHPLFARLDLEHIGLAGHSFGAVTTLTMAGRRFPFGRKSVDEPRIDAFLPMSPQPGKGMDPAKAFGSLTRPTFCMTGTKDGSPVDKSVTPQKRQLVYKSLPDGDKFHLVLDGAEHHAFGDNKSRRKGNRDPAHHGIIQALSLKFWDAYLKNDASAKTFLQSKSATSIKGFKNTDTFQWK